MKMNLKDCLRWVEKDGKKTLQVLSLIPHLDQNMQGTYEEVWTDIGGVDPGKPGSDKTILVLGSFEYGDPLTSDMDNTLAWKLGKITLEAGDPNRKDVGDPIDRGLILRRLLEEKGFYLVMKMVS
jgi:hypothetical protein